MASRLFRAIVGIGISLGTASVACSARVHSRQQADDPNGDEPASHASATPSASSTPPVVIPETDGGPLALDDVSHDAPHDAPLDAADTDATDALVITDGAHDSSDAMLDAFCDAAWPTTKGTPPPPCS